MQRALKQTGDERLLGSSDFVERVLRQSEEQLEEKYRLPSRGVSLQSLLDAYLALF